MSRRVIWKISVATTTEAEDAIIEALTHISGSPASSHNDFRTGRTTVSAYGDSKLAAPAKLRAELASAIAEIKSFGLNTGSGRISIKNLPRENWAESWKRHFNPIEIGDALLLKPSWSKRKPKRAQAVIVLDPGLSFGTGQHATTYFCLRELVRQRNPEVRQSLVDIGTGSGILAIAAVKLGYAPVEAFDFDPESVRVARANAKDNRVEGKLSITRKDLTKLPLASSKRHDVVCANLISTLLIAERQRIANRVKPTGSLVLAGILTKEFGQVQSAFEDLGFRLTSKRREKEWTSGSFRRA